MEDQEIVFEIGGEGGGIDMNFSRNDYTKNVNWTYSEADNK
jgi:hypothetical protein